VDEEYSRTGLGTIHISSLNLTFNPAQYDREPCAICSNGFAIWVCAEDLNPEWWGQQRASAANIVSKDIHMIFYYWVLLIAANIAAF